jgi:hypothetical protein
MRRCTVNSSDLALAARLSKALGARGGRLEPIESEIVHPPTRAASEPRADILPPAPEHFDSWEVLLAWSLELCRARAAFVVDGQGFVIATRGNVPADGFDGTGAELCFAMEQLERLEHEQSPLDSVELHFRDSKLFGIRVTDPDRGAFVLGFVGSRPVPNSIREEVLRQAQMAVPNLG